MVRNRYLLLGISDFLRSERRKRWNEEDMPVFKGKAPPVGDHAREVRGHVDLVVRFIGRPNFCEIVQYAVPE